MAERSRGRPKTDPYWIRWIRTQVANDPKQGVQALTKEAATHAAEVGRADIPSTSTIKRYRAAFLKAPEETQRDYRHVYWPETFERGDLPWEAQSAVLELMRNRESLVHHNPDTPRYRFRPDVRLARWYWRICQAAPGLDEERRVNLAIGLWTEESRTEPVYSIDGEQVLPASEAVRRHVEGQMLVPEEYAEFHEVFSIYPPSVRTAWKRLDEILDRSLPEEDDPHA